MKLLATILALTIALGGCASTTSGLCSRYGGEPLSEEEFFTGVFDAWDTDELEREVERDDRENMNEDGSINQGEFVAGWRAVGAFGQWDADGDDVLDGLECAEVGGPPE